MPSPTDTRAAARSLLCALTSDTVARDADIHLFWCSRPIPVCPLHGERMGGLDVPQNQRRLLGPTRVISRMPPGGPWSNERKPVLPLA